MDGPHAELAARRRDTETCWQDIPRDVLYLVPHAAAFLNLAGFRYYLPAFLIGYIHELDDHAEGVVPEDSVGFNPLAFFYISLLGSGQPVMDFRTRSKLNLLSAEQSRAVAHFLEFEVLRAAFYFDLYEEKPEDVDAESWPEMRSIDVEFWSRGAQQALKEYWGQFLE